MDKNQYKYDIKSKDDSKYTIEIKVEGEVFKVKKEEVYKKLKKNVEVKGFRPGEAPRTIIESKLGPKLYEQSVNELLPEIAMAVLKEEEINPVSQLQYNLKKVGEDEGVEFEIEFEGIGKINLPDFSKLKVKKEDTKVTKEEIDKVVSDMYDREKKSQESKKESDKTKSGDEKSDDKGEEEAKGKKEAKKSEEPTDEWASGLGIESVKSLEDLRKEVEKQLKLQKERQVEEKYIADMLNMAVEKADIEVPDSLVDKQVDQQEKSYKARIEQLGMKFDDFLKSKDVDMDELRDQWEDEIEASIAREILLVEVAKQQELKVEKDEVEKEISGIQDPQLKQQYDSQDGKNYIATVIIQQKAVNWIKDQVEKKSK